jgi:chaperone required for assembly of F1-ATPase
MQAARRLAAPPRQNRFYKTVEVNLEDGGYTLRLDGKAALTPGRRTLVVPHAPFAAAIAEEWAAQAEKIDPATMPVTRLANSALDGVAQRLTEVRADILAYAGADLLYYRAREPEGLVARQQQAWDPILNWAERRFGVAFRLADSVAHVTQPPETLAVLAAELNRWNDPFRLAGLHLATTLTGSALIALATAHGALDRDAAWVAAHVDEDWNIAQWGEDTEAMRRRARRFEDFWAAVVALR